MNRRHPSQIDRVAKEEEDGNETKFGRIHQFRRESCGCVVTIGLLDVDIIASGIGGEGRKHHIEFATSRVQFEE